MEGSFQEKVDRNFVLLQAYDTQFASETYKASGSGGVSLGKFVS